MRDAGQNRRLETVAWHAIAYYSGDNNQRRLGELV